MGKKNTSTTQPASEQDRLWLIQVRIDAKKYRR